MTAEHLHRENAGRPGRSEAGRPAGSKAVQTAARVAATGAAGLSEAEVLSLQRSIGNKETSKLLGDRPPIRAVQRLFDPGTITGKSHLRRDGAWDKKFGPAIADGKNLLADMSQTKTVNTAQWVAAANVAPDSKGKIDRKRRGYIRKNKVTPGPKTLETMFRDRIKASLTGAGALHPEVGGKLATDEHVDFLMNQGLRYKEWGGATPDQFASAFDDKEPKFDRLNEGAIYVAESLDHWRRWLHPTKSDRVKIVEVKFVESDLHEKGLGVVRAKFTKPKGGDPKFAADTTADVMIKPEDKGLEENLLGDDPGSAASKINQIVGLTDPKEMLTRIRMKSDENYGTLVERVKATPAEKLTNQGSNTIDPVFHETLVFAFLAGLDDLHGENVFWTTGGAPYLIDADNVLSFNQMFRPTEDNAQYVQSGFGAFNATEGQKSKTALSTKDNSAVNSKILNALLTDPTKRKKIVDAIGDSIRGKHGRVVPVRTNAWGKTVKLYPKYTPEQKDGQLDFCAAPNYIVRKNVPFSDATGPGLYGVSGENATDLFYDQAAEKSELRKDFEAGVIPFYNYDYDSGHVSHNGVKIYHGLPATVAMQRMLTYFGG